MLGILVSFSYLQRNAARLCCRRHLDVAAVDIFVLESTQEGFNRHRYGSDDDGADGQGFDCFFQC